MGNKAFTEQMKRYNIYIPPALKKESDKLAKKKFTSFSNIMRIALRNYMASENIKLKV